jgi:hypothetical protein
MRWNTSDKSVMLPEGQKKYVSGGRSKKEKASNDEIASTKGRRDAYLDMRKGNHFG